MYYVHCTCIHNVICFLKGSMPPRIGHMELLARMQRADFFNISNASNPMETP